MGAFSDDIEALFPMLDGLSCAFGADDEVGVFGMAEHLHHLFHEVVLVSAVDGHAANFLQEPSDAWLEELLLHHYLEGYAVIPIIGEADEEVLDGGMRRHDADGIAQVCWGFVDGSPTTEFEADFTYESFEFSHNNTK